MSDSKSERALWRPTTRLTIPLQTGAGFAMSLFMWGAFWMVAAALAATGVLLLVLGHWLLGPALALVGAFLMGAWWSFPRDVWVARPCDLELDAEGFRVVGGYHAGVRLSWTELDAEACGVRDGVAVPSQVLFAATRDGKKLPVAEGDEYASFAAVLDAWRASAGLAPLDREQEPKRAKKRRSKSAEAASPKPVSVKLVRCERCGAAACPRDAAETPCLYCSQPVSMPEDLRRRLREAASHAVLKSKSLAVLERLLAQPRAPLTLALLGGLGIAMLGSWLLAGLVFVRSLLRGEVDVLLVLGCLAAPLLFTLMLSTLASVVAVRRVAVRALAVEFAAIAPAEAGKPCGCRVCGAPLPELEQPVRRCAYCSSFNVVSSARPRAPSHVRDQLRSLEETLSAQSAELLVRWIFVALVGLPALWGAVGVLRWLWARLA